MTSTILLLGESNSGKSHFGGQLLGRLNRKDGALRMVDSAPSLSAFETVLDNLHNGRASPHTSAANYFESPWPVVDEAGNRVDLVWPDYGGEQLLRIRTERRMPREWRDRVVASSGWIVMVRIQHAQLSDDVFSRPLAELRDEPRRDRPFTMSEQAKLVDFLQWLVFTRGAGTLRPIATPSLMVLLSCWDELPAQDVDRMPSEVLADRMPLVSSFLQAGWAPEARHVMGLSALERPLHEDNEDADYKDRGPEAFGYVVKPDGTRSRDLTLAVAPLL